MSIASPVPPPLLDLAQAVVARHADSRLADLTLLQDGVDRWVALLTLADGRRLVLKAASPDHPGPGFVAARLKADAVRALADVPVPTPLAADDCFGAFGWRYLLQEHVAGTVWFDRLPGLDARDRDHAGVNLAALVARLHAPRFDAFGDFPGPSAPSAVVALERHAARIIRQPRQREDFLGLLDRTADLWEGLRAGICHDDLHGFNILMHPEEPATIAALLDVDKAWAGPIESDLARMELWRDMTGPAFLRRYRESIPETAGYAARRPIYQLLWCYEFAENTPAHLATTNALEGLLEVPATPAFEESAPKSER